MGRREKAIKITYEWKNNSDQTKKATDRFTFRGFQNGEDVDTFIFSDSIDTSLGSIEVEPGKSQDNCQTGFLLVEDSPMVISISKFDSFDSAFFEIEVDPSAFK